MGKGSVHHTCLEGTGDKGQPTGCQLGRGMVKQEGHQLSSSAVHGHEKEQTGLLNLLSFKEKPAS